MTKRKKNDDKYYDPHIKKLGYKTSSYFQNAKLYGVGINVSGGVNIEHIYIIKVIKKGKVKYVKYHKELERYFFVDSKKMADKFIWSEAEKVSDVIKNRNNNLDVKYIAIPLVSKLRGYD